jgi:hypothetical protein
VVLFDPLSTPISSEKREKQGYFLVGMKIANLIQEKHGSEITIG